MASGPKELVRKCGSHARDAIERATGIAATHGIGVVDPALVIACVLERDDLGACRVVDQLGVSRAGLRDRLFSDATTGPKVARPRPAFGESFFPWLAAAWELSRDLGAKEIQTGALLHAWLEGLGGEAPTWMGLAAVRAKIPGARDPLAAPVRTANPLRTAAPQPKNLIRKCSTRAAAALEAAVVKSLELNLETVEPSVLLASILSDQDCGAAHLLAQRDINAADIARGLLEAHQHRGDPEHKERPAFRPEIYQWIADAWAYASVEHDATSVETAHLLLTWRSFSSRYTEVRALELEQWTLSDFEVFLAQVDDGAVPLG